MARESKTVPEKAEKKKFSRRDFVVGSGDRHRGRSSYSSGNNTPVAVAQDKITTRFQPNTWFMTASTAPAVTAA